MTTPADDTAVEDAFEAYLAGRPVPEEAAGLAVFAEAVRATATEPGRPNAALAQLLATGLLADQSSPSARTARSAGTPPSRRRSRTRNRRRFAMIFPAILAKLLSAGAVAQAATGAGVVIVVAVGAGATGVLGEEVQDSIVGTVAAEDETATEDPLAAGEETLPEAATDVDPADAGATQGEESVDAAPLDEVAVAAQAWVDNGPGDYDSFGEWVSTVAGDRVMRAELDEMGLRFGDVVSAWAQKKGMSRDQLQSELESVGVELDAAADVTAEPGTGAASAPAPSQPRTPGNGRADDRSPGNGPGAANGSRAGNGNDNGNGPGAGNGGRGNGRN
ncbi:hypothetical protein [Blastococcus sp. PRF04-17]|uniref:hypothetical protein n=1 Tax=Blastococcus sp. PRF04-17 TaxID=2933797 RepID=UPI001FF5DEC0|nr:hypothetical protein [Blastococcus sp. PRF04-17]UOX99897.1 hypothetical protein MVA48_12735 [Blastococcus sp. PRF04-17]